MAVGDDAPEFFRIALNVHAQDSFAIGVVELRRFEFFAKVAQQPWLDRGRVKSIRYRGRGYKIALGLFVLSFVSLGLVGIGVVNTLLSRLFGSGLDIDQIEHWIGRAGLGGYFGFFLFTWAYTRFGFEQTRPVPERVT